MSYLNVHNDTVTAGVPKRIGLPGRKFCLMESVSRLSVSFLDASGAKIGEANNVLSGIEVAMPQEFTFVELSSATTQTFQVGTASLDVNFNRVGGSVTASIAQATALTNVAAVAVGTAAVEVKAANSAHMGAVFHAPSTNTAPVYVGAAGVTTDNGGIVLSPGDTWEETNAAAAAFHAISTAAAQSLRVQTRA